MAGFRTLVSTCFFIGLLSALVTNVVFGIATGALCISTDTCDDSNFGVACVPDSATTVPAFECRCPGVVDVACITPEQCVNIDANSRCIPSGVVLPPNVCDCSLTSALIAKCQPIGTVGGPCQSGNCVSKNSVCSGTGSTAICVCKAGFTLIDGSCVANGSFGGLCVGNACPLDKNAQCVDGRCVCTIFSSPFNGMCITIQANFGTCNTTCNDKNAACMSGMCMCNTTGAANIGGSCIATGAVFGPCATHNQCQLNDPNAICMNGMCMCQSGFTKVGSHCVRDGADGGVCLNNTCPNDINAQCVGMMCMCKPGLNRVNGICGAAPGSSGTACASGVCLDINANCLSSQCTCRAGFSRVAGTCVRDGKVGGKCVSTACPNDVNAHCSNGVCLCKAGFSSFGGSCRAVGQLHGMCSGALMNLCPGDSNAVCENMVCVCKPGTTAIDGSCVQDGRLGGICATSCPNESNTVCTNGTCVCASGYTEHNGMCTRNGAYGGICVSGRCPDTRGASCVNGWCVCSSSQVPYRGTCPRIRVPNRHHHHK